MTADEFLGEASPETSSLPSADDFLGQASTGETLGDRVKKFFFSPEGAQTTREAIQGAVESVPGMLAQIPKLAYQGVKFQTGSPQQQAQVIADISGQAVGQGRQTAGDIQQPFGTPQFLRGAGQIAMMAAPGLELGRELLTPKVAAEAAIEKPPIQNLEKPPIQSPEIPAEDVAAMEQRAATVQQYRGINPETGEPLAIDIPTAEQYLATPETPPTVAVGEPSPQVGRTAGIPESPEATTPGDIAAGQQPVEPPRPVSVGQSAPQGIVAPLGERIGTSKIGQSIEAKAVEAKLTQGFPEIAGYDPITIRDQAQRATNFIESSPTDARAVIRGEASLPEGLRGTSLITAMEENLLRKPDAQVAYELANSPLTSATSAVAQEMRLMSERVPDSLTAKFSEIQEARRAGSKLRGETPERVFNEVRQEIVKQSSKRPTWESFVREITCA